MKILHTFFNPVRERLKASHSMLSVTYDHEDFSYFLTPEAIKDKFKGQNCNHQLKILVSLLWECHLQLGRRGSNGDEQHRRLELGIKLNLRNKVSVCTSMNCTMYRTAHSVIYLYSIQLTIIEYPRCLQQRDQILVVLFSQPALKDKEIVNTNE